MCAAAAQCSINRLHIRQATHSQPVCVERHALQAAQATANPLHSCGVHGHVDIRCTALAPDPTHAGLRCLAPTPSGRGYKLAPTSFRDLFRRFGRSHFYFGAVLLQYVVACIAAGHLAGNDLFVLWAQLLVVLSLLFGPFFFTPFAFKTALVTVSTEPLPGKASALMLLVRPCVV